MSADGSPDQARYSPAAASDAELRLLGDLKGKRVLDLGCGDGRSSIAFARQGAITIGVDSSAAKLARAKERCTEAEVKVELRQGDLAELAFLRADSVDVVFSGGALSSVDDLGRVFRQVHRVLRVGAPLVFSVPHPASYMIDPRSHDPLRISRSYFDHATVSVVRDGEARTEYPHRLAELLTSLVRASYRVDAVAEPEPDPPGPRPSRESEVAARVPATLVVRARKEGS